jgi:uncharacterized protein (TIGR02996 family)
VRYTSGTMPRTATLAAPMPPAVHPERDALLRAIADDPDDDTPRLVYADWQDEHGQPEHAELIRVQCEAERLKGHAHTARRQALRARAKGLLKTPALRPMYGTAYDREDVTRGFLAETTVLVSLAADPIDRGSAGVPMDKVLDLRVVFEGPITPDLATGAAGCPWLGRATHFDFHDADVGPKALARLAASPHLGGLRELDFWLSRVDAGEFARMVLAPAARNLREVSLTNECRVTAGGEPDAAAFAAVLAKVCASPRAGRLTNLYLDTPELDDAAARVLAAAPRLDNLQFFGLYRRKITQPTVAALRKRFGDRLDLRR